MNHVRSTPSAAGQDDVVADTPTECPICQANPLRRHLAASTHDWLLGLPTMTALEVMEVVTAAFYQTDLLAVPDDELVYSEDLEQFVVDHYGPPADDERDVLGTDMDQPADRVWDFAQALQRMTRNRRQIVALGGVLVLRGGAG